MAASRKGVSDDGGGRMIERDHEARLTKIRCRRCRRRGIWDFLLAVLAHHFPVTLSLSVSRLSPVFVQTRARMSRWNMKGQSCGS